VPTVMEPRYKGASLRASSPEIARPHEGGRSFQASLNEQLVAMAEKSRHSATHN